ncbi:MAG: hypothetical protein PUB93_06795 [Firmicutes bacterium]|nr:hypothetical protein [Bacillota bacterium]
MKLWKTAVLFYLGGSAYLTLEFLWRGRSHGSMFLLGGTCFLLLGHLEKALPRLPLPVKVILGAAMVTALELLTGLLVNRDYSVWDYRHLPYQYRGQISLIFSLLWMPVSLAAMGLYRAAERRLDG